MQKAKQCQSPRMIPFRSFDEYKNKYKDVISLERSESGVVTAKFVPDPELGVALWDYPLHRGIGQLCADIGQDADTSVLIIGGTGNKFMGVGKTSLPDDEETLRWSTYEHSYYDGCNMVEGLVNDVEQPTIGVINGWAVHSEIALLCDITLMADTATIMDPHFCIGGGPPGDGIQIAFQACMGYKRANYALLTGNPITAKEALDMGMVNEIMPADKLYARAQEIAEQIAAKPRTGVRLMQQVLRQPVRELIAKELRANFGSEMWYQVIQNVQHDTAFAEMNKKIKQE